MKRAAEKLFDFPVVYRAKFFFTGLIFRLVKPVMFRTHFTLEEVLLQNIPGGTSVLEIGCGDGANFRLLAAREGGVGRFCGVDVNPHMVEYCRSRHPEARWLVAARPPYTDAGERFDRVVIINVLHHLDDRPAIVGILREAARLGTEIVLFEPLQSENPLLHALKRFYWLVTDGGNLYLRHHEFKSLFAEAGLVVKWEAMSAPLRHFYAARLTGSRRV